MSARAVTTKPKRVHRRSRQKRKVFMADFCLGLGTETTVLLACSLAWRGELFCREPNPDSGREISCCQSFTSGTCRCGGESVTDRSLSALRGRPGCLSYRHEMDSSYQHRTRVLDWNVPGGSVRGPGR